ncbi:MAG: hypothetical protein J5804_03400 [Eggerthellaceae bacterium]|nr:hypothetical protein [Eggerthellaceae bacterium]
MRFRQVMLSMAMAAFLAGVLTACGSSGSSGPADDSAQEAVDAEVAAAQEEEQAAAEALEQKAFEGHQAKDPTDLYAAVDEAITLAQMKQDEAESKDSDADDGDNIDPDASMASNDFNNGNAAYRNGEYVQAATLYESALEKDPLHYGANVNLALAQLQLEKDDMALLQALTCVYLFPDDPGCVLNAQVAATACGYGALDIHQAIDMVLGEAGDYSMVDVIINTDETEIKGACAYNDTWNQIDTDLYATAQESDQAGRDQYNALVMDLQTIADSYGSDPDIEQLQAYLEAAGVQLGYGDNGTASASASGTDAKSDSTASKDSSGSVLQTIAG